MKFSRRLPGDLRPTPLATARARHGAPEIDLTVSNPTACAIEYPRGLLDPLSDSAASSYAPDPRGPRSARLAIARWYRRWGVDLDPDTIVLTASTSEAYGYLLKLLADPGDALLVPAPSYPLFEPLARLEAVRTVGYRLAPESGWRLDPDSLADAPMDCRAVVAVHPNNPTGSFVDSDDATLLSTLCRDRGCALIVDEVFLPYPIDEGRQTTRSLAGGGDCLSFVLGGLSKAVGLPQLKLAWIAAAGPQIEVDSALERLDHIADAYLSVSTPVALAVDHLLTQGESVRRAIAARCRRNLRQLQDLTADEPAITVDLPAGGWSAVLRVPAVLDDEALTLRLLEGSSVAVHPGYLFDFEGDGWLVLSLLPPEEVFAEGLRRLLATVREICES